MALASTPLHQAPSSSHRDGDPFTSIVHCTPSAARATDAFAPDFFTEAGLTRLLGD